MELGETTAEGAARETVEEAGAQFEMQAFTNVNAISANVSAALGVRRSITETANADFYFSGNQSLIPLAQGALERRFYAFGFFVAVTGRF